MASVVVGATLTECIYTAVSVTALSNFMIHENWDSRHSRLQTLAAFAERFRNQGLDSYPTFSVKLETEGKIRVVPV